MNNPTMPPGFAVTAELHLQIESEEPHNETPGPCSVTTPDIHHNTVMVVLQLRNKHFFYIS